MGCPVCFGWAREGRESRDTHHARCPLRADLRPRHNGACHCGHTIPPGRPRFEGCEFCGGWTANQYAAALGLIRLDLFIQRMCA